MQELHFQQPFRVSLNNIMKSKGRFIDQQTGAHFSFEDICKKLKNVDKDRSSFGNFNRNKLLNPQQLQLLKSDNHNHNEDSFSQKQQQDMTYMTKINVKINGIESRNNEKSINQTSHQRVKSVQLKQKGQNRRQQNKSFDHQRASTALSVFTNQSIANVCQEQRFSQIQMNIQQKNNNQEIQDSEQQAQVLKSLNNSGMQSTVNKYQQRQQKMFNNLIQLIQLQKPAYKKKNLSPSRNNNPEESIVSVIKNSNYESTGDQNLSNCLQTKQQKIHHRRNFTQNNFKPNLIQQNRDLIEIDTPIDSIFIKSDIHESIAIKNRVEEADLNQISNKPDLSYYLQQHIRPPSSNMRRTQIVIKNANQSGFFKQNKLLNDQIMIKPIVQNKSHIRNSTELQNFTHINLNGLISNESPSNPMVIRMPVKRRKSTVMQKTARIFDNEILRQRCELKSATGQRKKLNDGGGPRLSKIHVMENQNSRQKEQVRMNQYSSARSTYKINNQDIFGDEQVFIKGKQAEILGAERNGIVRLSFDMRKKL